MEEIVNRVQESGLIPLDLAKFKPNVELTGIDIADQLWQGLILKEKDFRAWIKDTDWKQYTAKAVYIFCSVDAIVPTWAYMLVASQLENNSIAYIVGSKSDLEKMLIQKEIYAMDISEFKDGRVIVKGCADISNPEYAMTELIKRLQPHVKSIMYGEPCSTVPIYKRR